MSILSLIIAYLKYRSETTIEGLSPEAQFDKFLDSFQAMQTTFLWIAIGIFVLTLLVVFVVPWLSRKTLRRHVFFDLIAGFGVVQVLGFELVLIVGHLIALLAVSGLASSYGSAGVTDVVLFAICAFFFLSTIWS